MCRLTPLNPISRDHIAWVLENRWKQLTRQTGPKTVEVDWMGVQREVEVGLARRMRREA